MAVGLPARTFQQEQNPIRRAGAEIARLQAQSQGEDRQRGNGDADKCRNDHQG